jgi:hypothetical protein
MFRYSNTLLRGLKIKKINRNSKLFVNKDIKKEKEYKNYKMIKRSWVIGDEEKIKKTWAVK